ncbi:MAG: hypothetical protein RL632_273 [Bacteroidota bacterium]|jgi:beta-aspartyl-peptidase (threonine type)
MSYLKVFVVFFFILITVNCQAQKKEELSEKYVLVIHGGAGTISRSKLTPALEYEYRCALEAALQRGQYVLDTGGLAITAVEVAVKYLEDSPLFNAGKGSVFSHEGVNEMDACIMNGKDLSSGAVAGVRNLKNPIEGARLVKDSSKHVFLYGEDAQDFCLAKGATYADSSYFFTEFRWKQFLKARDKGTINLDHDTTDINYQYKTLEELEKFGTVGAVALDRYGNVAAATSTGGLTNKEYGRIGDSPIVGAGTYASNRSCAVSCTGKGEFFIRGTVARDIAARMEFGDVSLSESGERTMKRLNKLGGSGGFISVDKDGNYILMFNTKGMYRGVVTNEKNAEVKIY